MLLTEIRYSKGSLTVKARFSDVLSILTSAINSGLGGPILRITSSEISDAQPCALKEITLYLPASIAVYSIEVEPVINTPSFIHW
ncbi:hypothetical protein D3C86_1713310 [compost metagenome]